MCFCIFEPVWTLWIHNELFFQTWVSDYERNIWFLYQNWKKKHENTSYSVMKYLYLFIFLLFCLFYINTFIDYMPETKLDDFHVFSRIIHSHKKCVGRGQRIIFVLMFICWFFSGKNCILELFFLFYLWSIASLVANCSWKSCLLSLYPNPYWTYLKKWITFGFIFTGNPTPVRLYTMN